MTHIGPAAVVIGDLECDDDLIVDAHVRGRIRVRDALLTIGAHGRLDGDIRARRVVVRGEVHGSIWAGERIELVPSAVVRGTLSANHVVVADGATFNGRIDMDRRTIAARVAKYMAEHAGAMA
jgi:cytoskeletal protein CcmA (bactofilin family)